MAKGTNDYRTTDRPSPATKNGYVRLAAGILAHAAKEARAGDLEALHWLLTEQAELLAGGVGLSYAHVRRWAGERAREAG